MIIRSQDTTNLIISQCLLSALEFGLGIFEFRYDPDESDISIQVTVRHISQCFDKIGRLHSFHPIKEEQAN